MDDRLSKPLPSDQLATRNSPILTFQCPWAIERRQSGCTIRGDNTKDLAESSFGPLASAQMPVTQSLDTSAEADLLHRVTARARAEGHSLAGEVRPNTDPKL